MSGRLRSFWKSQVFTFQKVQINQGRCIEDRGAWNKQTIILAHCAHPLKKRPVTIQLTCISGLKRESFRNGTPSEFVSRLHLCLVVLSWFESSDDVAHCLETGALDLGSGKDHVSPIRSSVDDLPPITVAHAVVHSCVCLVLLKNAKIPFSFLAFCPGLNSAVTYSSWAEFPLALVVEGLGVSVFRARIVRKPPEQQLVLLDGTERLHGPADVVAVPPAASGGAAEFGRVGLA
jgi:hypothetical protein